MTLIHLPLLKSAAAPKISLPLPHMPHRASRAVYVNEQSTTGVFGDSIKIVQSMVDKQHNTLHRMNISYRATLVSDTALPTSGILGYADDWWLRNDEEDRLRRYLHCDFDQLCQRVIQVCLAQQY